MKRIDVQKYVNEILAFANGKTIEHKSVGSGTWYEDENPSFACHLEYRIKPGPKLVPFTFDDRDSFRDKFIALNRKSAIFRITSINLNGVSISGGAGSHPISYRQLFDDYQFEDGSSCGKLINE